MTWLLERSSPGRRSARRAGDQDPRRGDRLAPGGHPGPAWRTRRSRPSRSGPGSARTAPGRCRRSGPSAAAACAIPVSAKAYSARLRSISYARNARHSGVTRRCVEVDAEASQVLLRQVHPAAVEVLVDVAQEVGQLEGQPERAGRRVRLRAGRLAAPAASSPRSPRPSPPCSRSRSSQVSYVLVVRSIAIAPKNRSKHSGSMPQVRTVCTIAASTGSSLPRSTRAVAEATPRTPCSWRLDRRRAPVVVGQVDDVVGQPAQRVDRVHVLALRPGQQHRAPEVGGAVPPGQPRTLAGSPRRSIGSRLDRAPAGTPRPAPRPACPRSAPSARRPRARCRSRRRTARAPAAPRWRAGTGRSGRRCGPARTGSRPPCPARSQSSGVTSSSVTTSLG